MSLKKAFLALTLGFLAIALVLGSVVFVGCIILQQQFEGNAVVVEMGGEVTASVVEHDADVVWKTGVLSVVQIAVPVLLVIGSMVAADIVFYRVKLKGPLRQLEDGSKRILEGELDFHMTPLSEDELGRLTGSFDEMRSALLEYNREMWRQAEERKRLNAAFSHDLRNPVTVLKGQINLLGKQVSDNDKLHENITMMGDYVNRVEGYVEAMSKAGRLEELPFSPSQHQFETLANDMEKASQHLAEKAGKKLVFSATGQGEVRVDSSLLFNVTENLTANALRYAQSQVVIELLQQEGTLLLAIQDDGHGFPQSILHEGAKPFLRGENQDTTTHFGMGLYICRLLCEKHGGALKLDNNERGALVVAVLSTDI